MLQTREKRLEILEFVLETVLFSSGIISVRYFDNEDVATERYSISGPSVRVIQAGIKDPDA